MADKPLINLIFIGHVDHGKSTTIGRTLYESGAISEVVMKLLEEETAQVGKEHAKFAWIMDKLKDERESDQTTDISYRSFETKNKVFTIIDAPGHRNFVRNMITGASQADAAVLVISAAPGQFEAGVKSSDITRSEIGGQTREHAALAFTLGIKQLVVATNKMDTVGYDKRRFNEIREAITSMLKTIGYSNADQFAYVPIAAFTGENIMKRSPNMNWYTGDTLLEALDKLEEPAKPIDRPFRMPVQRSFNVPGVGIVPVGRVETGELKVGDEVIVIPSGVKVIVRHIEMFHRELQRAVPGDNVGISLKGIKRTDVWKGCVIAHPIDPPVATVKLKARIMVVEHPTEISKGYRPTLYCHTDHTEVTVEEIESKIDQLTNEIVESRPSSIKKGDVASVWLVADKPIVIERVSDNPRLSRFALRDMGTTVAVGLCTEITI